MPRGISRKQDMNELKRSFMWLGPWLSMAGVFAQIDCKENSNLRNAKFLITKKFLENNGRSAEQIKNYVTGTIPSWKEFLLT